MQYDGRVCGFINHSLGLVTMTGALTINGNLTMTATATNRLLLPISNVATTPTLAFGDGDTGFYESADDQLYVSLGGNAQWYFYTGFINSSSSTGVKLLQTGVSSINATVRPRSNDASGVGSAATGQPSMIGNEIESQRWIPKVDTDSDTDDVLATGVSGFHGLAMVISLTDDVSAIFHIDNTTLTSNISLNAAITSTKDNAGTYNFYYETDQFKLQNKVGDNKSVQVIFWVVPT